MFQSRQICNITKVTLLSQLSSRHLQKTNFVLLFFVCPMWTAGSPEHQPIPYNLIDCLQKQRMWTVRSTTCGLTAYSSSSIPIITSCTTSCWASGSMGSCLDLHPAVSEFLLLGVWFLTLDVCWRGGAGRRRQVGHGSGAPIVAIS